MSPEDRIRGGNAVLVFDAPNVSAGTLLRLAKAAANSGNRCVVPVTAHIETLAHIRRKHATDYDAGKIKQALEDTGVRVMMIDDDTANSIVERLFEWFPTDDDWQNAKWERLCEGVPRVKSRHPPATIDWFTAAMCPRDAIVVTSDKGSEYQRCDRIGWEKLERILKELEQA
jgi:hypothetical protein